MNLSNEQKYVVDNIMDMFHSGGYHKPPDYRDLFVTTVGGYAGTGKTTLIAELRQRLRVAFPRLSVAFLTFTGKASSVLMEKLGSVDVTSDYIGTIHGLIYVPEVAWSVELKTYVVTGWKLRSQDEMYFDVFIIDEASMVSFKIWRDLLKFGRPVVAIGDHGQLPPIGSESFSLVAETDFKLTKIHRQALNSPIIKLSKWVREHGYIPFNRVFSQHVFKLAWDHPKCKKIWNDKVVFDEDLIILTAFNTTRANMNDIVRKKLDHKKKLPYPGEQIVCLQNDHHRGIMNGQIGTILWIMTEDHGLYRMTLSVDHIPDPVECTVSNKCFGQVQYTMYDRSKESEKQHNYAVEKGINPVNYFDYGYAMSVHKSQGSEWKKVILFEQRTKRWSDEYYAKWLYTAVTRAKEKLFIISDYWG